ncbi:HTH-type transcriptional regulator immR, partial [Dysosmobacter welbionis]
CPAGPLPLQALHGLPHPQGGGRHAPNRGRWSRLCGPPPPALPGGSQSVHPGDPAGPPVRSGGGVHRGAGPGHPGAAGAGLRRQPPGVPGPVPGLQSLCRPLRPGLCHPGRCEVSGPLRPAPPGTAVPSGGALRPGGGRRGGDRTGPGAL